MKSDYDCGLILHVYSIIENKINGITVSQYVI